MQIADTLRASSLYARGHGDSFWIRLCYMSAHFLSSRTRKEGAFRTISRSLHSYVTAPRIATILVAN